MDSDLLPARMINEFVYCPRLFYLEWVEGRFVDNDDTRLGQRVHRRVDEEAGAVPLPDDGELRRARSVTLSSDQLGVIAKLDVIEGVDGAVVPVDFKKGSPQADGTPWPSDEVQVVIQGMLLREHGFLCDHAELWYADVRRRVYVELTDDRLGWVRDMVADARGTADRARAPLPLVDSPKCPRCSLLGLCLPDETNALLARQDTPPRRLVPRDSDQRPVYVTEPGAFVGVRSSRLQVTVKKEELGSFRMIDVSHLAVFGRVQVSTQALTECFARGIPVLWMSSGGWLQGFAQGQMSKYVELRRRQTAVHAQGGAGLAQQMIVGKILNSRTLLRRNARGDVAATVAALRQLADKAGDGERLLLAAGHRGHRRSSVLRRAPGDARANRGRVRRGVLPAGTQPPPAARSAQRSAVVLLLDVDKGPCRHLSRAWASTRTSASTPIPLRPAGAGPRPRRGVPAAHRGLRRDRSPEQWRDHWPRLHPPGAGGVLDRRWPPQGARCVRAASRHPGSTSGLRLPHQLSTGAGRAGAAVRRSSGRRTSRLSSDGDALMARRRYLTAYDIADPGRLRRICTLMEDHGERLQYSVFLCDLTVAERAELEDAVVARMNLQEDSVVQIDLGPIGGCATVRSIGRPRRLPSSGPQIV